MYDDWNETKHTEDWLKKIISSVQKQGSDQLTIYYKEENEKIIGVAFALMNSDITLDTLAKDGIVPELKEIAHVTGFHMIEAYRGKGYGSSWLVGEIFDDLRTQGIKQVYIKSSHHQALALYERLGTKVGNYVSISDSKLYQRCGHIYKIDL